MRRCRLRLAGAFLLSTLLLSFAEAGWAATCDPSMGEMPQSEMAGMAEMPEAPSSHDCPPGHEHGAPGQDDGDCPFTLPGGVGCVATASLPADITRMSVRAHVRALGHSLTEMIAHHLLAHSIFHPPKA